MKKFLLSIIAYASFSVGTAQQICISPAALFPVNNDPRDIIKGDFNNDGLIDIATANPGRNNVCVLRSVGTGSFAAVDSFATGGYYPQGLTTADFNGDGKQDIATANNSGNNISILQNSGTGSFSLTYTFTSSGTSPAAITTGDFNGDGKPDLATANVGSNDVSIYLNSGTGSFGPATSYTAGNSPWYIICNDFNNDAKPDLAIVNHLGNDISILLGNGIGGFSAPGNFSVGTDPRRIGSGDFNGDGNLDLAVPNYGSGDISVLMGTGTGSFSAAVSYPTGGGPHVITCVDMTGDSKLDLAVADVTLSKIYIFSGVGDGTFNAFKSFSIYGSGPPSPYGIIAADFNADSYPDLATANASSNDVGVFLNIPTFIPSVSGPTVACSGDNVVLTASGATTYTWSANAGSATTNTVSLVPGVTETYTVMFTTGICQATDTFQLLVNPLPSLTVTTIDATCNGACNGTATVTGSAISYTWTPTNQTGTTANGLCGGLHQVIGIDGNGCTYTANVGINQPALLIAGVTNLVNATCTGVNNGAADDATSGGTPGYTYQWSCGNTAASVSGLAAGNYYLAVTDAQACIDTVFFTISTLNPDPVPNINGSPFLCPGQAGQYTCTVGGGGTAPFTNSWTDILGMITAAYNDSASLQAYGPGHDTLTVTTVDAMGCTGAYSWTITIGPYDTLSGMVTEPNSNPVSSGEVYLFKQKLSHMGAYDTVSYSTITNGSYLISNFSYGNFYLKVIADSTVYPNSIPTYLSNKTYPFQWDSAMVLPHNTCNATNIGGVNVQILEIIPLSGPGVISGYVTAGPGYGQRIIGGNQVMGAPLKGVDVKLGRNPGGSPAARTTTDTITGQYVFTNVPLNQAFTIYVDIPNYGMDSTLTVTLTSADTVSDQNNYFVDSLMIRVDSAAFVNVITFKDDANEISLFPNPASDRICIEWNGANQTEMTVINSVGSEVRKEKLRQNKTFFDTSMLPGGLYFVQMRTGKSILTRKFIIQH